MNGNTTNSGAVSARAAEWIGRVLREAGMPPTGRLLHAMEDNSLPLELSLLKVNQLKKISSEISNKTILFQYNNPSTSVENLIYFPPKSGAKKSEWVASISSYFNQHASNNNIYNILHGGATTAAITNSPSHRRGVAAAAAAAVARASASAKKPSPARGTKMSPTRKSPSKTKPRKQLVTAAAFAKKPSPAKTAKHSPNRKRKSPSKAKSTFTSTNNTNVTSDEAFARSLQMQEDFGNNFFNQNNPLAGINGFNPWGGPLSNSNLQNHASAAAASNPWATNPITTSNGNMNGKASPAGLKRPAQNDITKPKALPVKVKKEPGSYVSNSNNNVSAASSSNEDANLQPRGFRETNMVATLRQMGFDNTQEILTALRAVAAQREEVSIISGGVASSGWEQHEQVDAAMMWIVTQREEAAEAQKLDEARISSEQADAAMEQSRRTAMERELHNADSVDLLGSVEEDDSLEIRSRHFPLSDLLRSKSVRTVLQTVVASGIGKDQVIRLLSLEKKARKWYGTVLPYSYFAYILCPRFEGLAKELLTIGQKISEEADELEKAMYNLSEQEEGGVGFVPKVFLAAQREATEKGKPISALKAAHEDDVEVLPLPAVGKSLNSTQDSNTTGQQSAEVIDLL